MSENGQGLSIRAQKVKGIFRQFDRNQDGCLNRNEMAGLVIAVNPRVKFSKEQIEAILDEVFRTYGEFIKGTNGLSFEGLLRTYDDGAGDVDRDFDALGLQLTHSEEEIKGLTDVQRERRTGGNADIVGDSGGPSKSSIANETLRQGPRRLSKVGEWAKSPNHGVVYDDTWRLIEDLEALLRKQDSKIEDKRKQREDKRGAGLNGLDTTAEWEDSAEKREALGGRRGEEELGSDYGAFKKSLAELRQRAGKVHTPDEAFDGHMAMGKSLLEHRWPEEALPSFKLAVERKPQDVRAHFLVGNALYSLGQYKQAREAYQRALEAAEESSHQWVGILPQVKTQVYRFDPPY